ncbi:MAG: hypothetical protein WD073_00215, partial [Xanthobacteraceae bacterium]
AKLPVSGLVIGAVYPDMRHDIIRKEIAELLRDPQTRGRLERTERGREILMRIPAEPQERAASASESKQNDASPMTRTERAVTEVLESWIGLETLRGAGRALVRLTLEDVRRYFESLRARYTRDLSRYRVPILPQRYRENMKAWRAIFETARDAKIPMLVYIAPRPGDFYPFDADGYGQFKRDIEALARETGAAFVNLEDAVPNREWGEVDLSFGFLVRDPFHFTAQGHALMAEALLPHIKRTFRIGRAAP